jgi:hypothetical protein
MISDDSQTALAPSAHCSVPARSSTYSGTETFHIDKSTSNCNE